MSADQALRSYKWSYIRLAALNLRWQNLLSYWAIAVVLTLLGRTMSYVIFDETDGYYILTSELIIKLLTKIDKISN